MLSNRPSGARIGAQNPGLDELQYFRSCVIFDTVLQMIVSIYMFIMHIKNKPACLKGQRSCNEILRRRKDKYSQMLIQVSMKALLTRLLTLYFVWCGD